MREREVTKVVAARLREEGALNLKVRYGSEGGPDIECDLPGSGRRLYVEAKGFRAGGKVSQNCRTTVGEALLQIFSIYDRDVLCAMALPYSDGYTTVVRNIMPGLRVLGVHVLLVRGTEVWHLRPDSAGFFPSVPESIVEELDK